LLPPDVVDQYLLRSPVVTWCHHYLKRRLGGFDRLNVPRLVVHVSKVFNPNRDALAYSHPRSPTRSAACGFVGKDIPLGPSRIIPAFVEYACRCTGSLGCGGVAADVGAEATTKAREGCSRKARKKSILDRCLHLLEGGRFDVLNVSCQRKWDHDAGSLTSLLLPPTVAASWTRCCQGEQGRHRLPTRRNDGDTNLRCNK